MAYLDHGADPPDELTTWFDWQYFGLAPEAGGLNDQPAGLLERIRAAIDMAQAWRAYRSEGTRAGQMAAWREAHPREWSIVHWMQDTLKSE